MTHPGLHLSIPTIFKLLIPHGTLNEGLRYGKCKRESISIEGNFIQSYLKK
jgi:hypothetical protein